MGFIPSVYCLTATCGRHSCLERLVRFFLDQDFTGDHTLLIYNNSDVSQVLHLPEDLPSNKHIKLVNNHICYTTKTPYQNLGEIYTDMLKLVPDDTDIVCFWDDDDIFLPNHLSEGVRGLFRGSALRLDKALDYIQPALGYKPAKSYYRHDKGIDTVSNTLEPSIFVYTSFIKEHGFYLTTSDQHLKWVEALGNRLYVDQKGKPTLVYNWGDTTIPTFKTSGDPGNPKNFENYRRFSQDHGDGIVVPIKPEHSQKYYEQINYFINEHRRFRTD